MSLQTGTTQTSRPYRTLLEVHLAAGRSDFERTLQVFSYLPQEMRNRIFGHIYNLAGRPQHVEYTWGEIHVFDDLPRLQIAIERIAFEAFDNLNTGLRNTATGGVYEHGSPQTQDLRWGETHATDDVEIPPQSLDDIRTDHIRTDLSLSPSAPSEIVDILDTWAREDVSGEENRREAEKRIMDFFNHPPRNGKLDLSNLELSSLPQIFHADVFTTRLIRLNLYFNKLQSLPEQIGQLQALKDLDIASNKLRSLSVSIGLLQALKNLDIASNSLQSLPEQIGQLPVLQYLDVSNNQLQSLPEQIGQLPVLHHLDVSNNQLQSLPEQIGQLPVLQYLDVSNNQLQSLPEQIGQLPVLEYLDVSNNQLQSLPESIGQLQALRYSLTLANNPSLTGIPMQILDLPSSITINLASTGLSQAVLTRLREATSSPDYHGPRISYSMELSEPRTEERPIESLMRELFRLAGQPIREFPNLFNAEQRQQVSLHSWLSRLSYTADYKKGGEKQKAFARKVLGYMQLAEENPQYREAFFLTIEDASETCGDRVALSILKLGIAFKLMIMDKKNLDALSAFLIKTVWPVQMLEVIARNKVPTLPFFDEIEVYLAYPVQLKQTLGLEIDVEEMLYFTCSALKEQDLDEAAEFVREKAGGSRGRAWLPDRK